MFAGDLHTRTAVARLPLHQLDYLVVNWSIRVTHR